MRVPLPGYVQLNGHTYLMSDWSVRGATVEIDPAAKAGPLKAGQSFSAFLIFKMDSFLLHVPMQVAIQRVDPARKQMGVVFQEMSPRQLSIMQQLVRAYIGGELTSVGDIIHVVERNNFVKQRSMPKAGPLPLSKRTELFFRKLAVFGLALLVFGYLALSIYERNFVVEASNAYVDASGFTLNAPTSGTMLYAGIDHGDSVKQGAPLGIIQSRTGNNTTVESPCNCIVSQMLVANGSEVFEGDSVIALVPGGALIYVTAYVPYEDARELYRGQKAQIALAGSSTRISGKIDYISSAATTENDIYQLRIVSEERIDPLLLGTPAHVSIDTLR